MTHDEEKFNEYLQRLARELDPAPEVPREELWARIDAARRPHRSEERTVVDIATRRRVRPQLVRWAVALAAMLVVGVAIGRLTLMRGTAGGPAVAANEAATNASDSAAQADSAALLPYRLAAVQHLVKTEALLAALPTDARTGQVDEVAGWAGDLLTDTRLLLDSPAGQDAELKQLLEDLELVLAQIAVLKVRGAAGEVEMIQDGMNQRDVLLRLRAATASPTLAGS